MGRRANRGAFAYEDAVEYLKKARDSHRGRPIARNTRLKIGWDQDTVEITFWHTTIIVIYPNGDYRLNSGGYRTISTKERLARFMPRGYDLYSKRGEWRVRFGPFDIPFFDGILLYRRYHVPGEELPGGTEGN